METNSNKANRLRKLAHYIIARTKPHELGATRLNKVMWFADIASFKKVGRTISGLSAYTRMQFGPVPTGIDKEIEQLKRCGAIVETLCETPKGKRREFVCTLEPEIEKFSKIEIDIISQAIREVVCRSAKEISEMTHDSLWEETRSGQPISVAQSAVGPLEVAENDIGWAQSEMRRLGI